MRRLICALLFAYGINRFSHDVTQYNTDNKLKITKSALVDHVGCMSLVGRVHEVYAMNTKVLPEVLYLITLFI